MKEREQRIAIVMVLALAMAIALIVGLALDDSGDSQDGSPTASRSLAPDGEPLKETDGLFHGTYVGRATKARALVAVEAAPPVDGKERSVSVFVCDGKGVAEFFPATVSDNTFTLASGDDDTTVTGKLTANEVTGTIRFGRGRTIAFTLLRAAGASGLYDLAVDAKGTLSGGTENGVGATGRTALAGPGNGHLDLADGRRVVFKVRAAANLSAGGAGARLIVLGDGQVAGLVQRNRATVALSS